MSRVDEIVAARKVSYSHLSSEGTELTGALADIDFLLTDREQLVVAIIAAVKEKEIHDDPPMRGEVAHNDALNIAVETIQYVAQQHGVSVDDEQRLGQDDNGG